MVCSHHSARGPLRVVDVGDGCYWSRSPAAQVWTSRSNRRSRVSGRFASPIQKARMTRQGPLARIEGRLDGHAIEALVARHSAEGRSGELHLTVRRAHVFPA